MASGQHNFQIETLEVPLPQDAIDELFALWDRFFERRDEDFRDVYTGNETEHNRDIVYVIRRDARLVGTVHLTISKTGPRLGGLGGVATDPEFRGQGMASTLCARAAEGFREAGGQALFLGTNNPAAFRVYRRCGWRRLPSTNVMVLTTTDASPEEFLADHFSEWAPATPAEASPGMRLPMVPLIVAPHNWEALDANVRDYFRMFMMPGVLHCGGGPGPARVDWLAILVDWVENGKPSERVVASKFDEDGQVVRTRPLCAYPQRAFYIGKGDTNEQESFICRDP